MRLLQVGFPTTFLIVACSFLVTGVTGAADGLPAGCHKASLKEAWNNPGIIGRVVCPADQAAGVTEDAGSAKQYLQGTRCNGGVDIARLDNKFAVCAAKFLKELRQHYPSACINSAYRSAAHQADACRRICGNPGGCKGTCAPPGHSYHQKGLAIDMQKYGNNHQQMWQIAARSGLHNPPGLHSSDPIHVQASGAANCAGIPVNLGDGGDYFNDKGRYFPAPPADYQAPTGQPSPQTQPLNPGPQNPLDQKCTLPDGLQVPCSAIANGSGAPAGTPQGAPAGNSPPPTLPPSQQPSKYLQSASETSKPVSDLLKPSAGTGIDFLTRDQASTSSKKKASAIEEIEEIAGVTPSAAETGTSSSLVLNLSAEDSQKLADEKVPTQGGSTSSPESLRGNVPPSTQQTFTSGDLKNNLPQTKYPNQVSGFQMILTSIKETLLKILAYLKPFGRPQPEGYDDWAE